MRIWTMQSSYRCLHSFLAALNGAQRQRMLSLFWNAAQSSIHATITVNYPWLIQCGVLLAICYRGDDHLCHHHWRWGTKVCCHPWTIHMLPAVYCSCLNGFRMNVRRHHKPHEAAYINCDTSFPSVSWGRHSFPYIPWFASMGALEGEGVSTQITGLKWSIL